MAPHHLQLQHRRLELQAASLVGLALGEDPDVMALRRTLARFSGALRTHASMEDEGLYPALLAHPDPAIRERAECLRGELGPLYSRWDSFMARWNMVDRIQENLPRFRAELATTLQLLGRRMKLEDRELYPMVEAL